jgi:Zn-dependent peptidase ImmA (M78 family)
MTSSFAYLKSDVQEKIQKFAKETLIEATQKDPPVIIESIYEYYDLKMQTFSKNNSDFIELCSKIKCSNSDFLRGVLFVDKKIAVARDDGYYRRTKFVYGHELGHWKIKWHKNMLYQCTQFDLSQNARKQMEREANFYTSELLFMGETFTETLFYSELSLERIKSLADTFQMSKESTLRRAVELEQRPCAFISFDVDEKSVENFLTVKYPIHSQSFIEKIGEFNVAQSMSKDHQLSQILIHPIYRALNSYKTEVTFGKEKKPLKTEVWYNGHNVLAFFQPAE